MIKDVTREPAPTGLPTISKRRLERRMSTEFSSLPSVCVVHFYSKHFGKVFGRQTISNGLLNFKNL